MSEIINEFIVIMQNYGFEFSIKDKLTLSKDFYNNRKFKISDGIEEISIINELVEIKIQEDYNENEIKINEETHKNSMFFINNDYVMDYKEIKNILYIKFINEFGGTELEISFSSLN